MEPVFRIVMSIWLHAAFMFQITLFNGKSGEAISLCSAGCKSPNSYSSFRFEMKLVDRISEPGIIGSFMLLYITIELLSCRQKDSGLVMEKVQIVHSHECNG